MWINLSSITSPTSSPTKISITEKTATAPSRPSASSLSPPNASLTYPRATRLLPPFLIFHNSAIARIMLRKKKEFFVAVIVTFACIEFVVGL